MTAEYERSTLRPFFAPFRGRRKRPSKRRLSLRGISAMSLTSLAPSLRRSSTILRLRRGHRLGIRSNFINPTNGIDIAIVEISEL
jgi:hypothetical protein